ncbi:MAG: ABC transporter ATP-binding protein [Thermomicrobiales bacterium]|jgi:ABC-2 type transport system ATP-binding protein|nr:ABC transporter ATP-binding protein [Thermomicrobiales bacterium]
MTPTIPQSTAASPAAILTDEPTILFDHVSKWYGDLVAVSDLSFSIGPGVTALLGPNGSGKTTSLKMISGLIGQSAGRIEVRGLPPRGNIETYRRFGLVNDIDNVYPYLTGWEFVWMNARLQRLPDPDAATRRAVDIVEMGPASDRRIGGYSKGMRQRIKLAAALVHDPDVILMDEPLNGTDPAQRAHMIELIREFGRQGKTVLVSSHVLVEVERFAENILVIVNGKLAAAGNYRTIRNRIDNRPLVISLRASNPRKLGAALLGSPAISSISVGKDDHITAETNDAATFYRIVPAVARQTDVRLLEIEAADESLESVFSYLVER